MEAYDAKCEMSNLKENIVNDYTVIADFHDTRGAEAQRGTVCLPIYAPIAAAYRNKRGFIDAADLALGCGFPFDHADIQDGHSVADLGCASGIDSFIASDMVGENGQVIGFDLTPRLVERATEIAHTNNRTNVRFEVADIQTLPLQNESMDAVISNGVFSLIPSIEKVFEESFRVLKSTGVFAFADITQNVTYSSEDQPKINSFTGCLNGIRSKDLYTKKLIDAGFRKVIIVEERTLDLSSLSLNAGSSGLAIVTFKCLKNE